MQLADMQLSGCFKPAQMLFGLVCKYSIHFCGMRLSGLHCILLKMSRVNYFFS